MRISRFFLSESDLQANCLGGAIAALPSVVTVADRAQVDQMRNVLRLKKGARIDLLDMHGHIFRCEIAEMSPHMVRSQVLSTATAAGDPPVALTVALALIKGDRFELAVQKLTEIGVSTIVPIEAARSVVRGDDTTGDAKRTGAAGKKMLRWQAIAREAAEQSERATIPQISPPLKLESFLTGFTTGGNLDIALICAERMEAQLLRNKLPALMVADKKTTTSDRIQIGLLIGPEGGWTEEEVVSAQKAGWEPVSLGPRILRAETAAIISAAQIICTFET